MRLRSLLFVPADRPERFAKALASGADAIILDLEDSVVPDRKPAGREAIRAFLKSADMGGTRVLVRINPLNSRFVDDDLAALAGLTPGGIVLPKAKSADTVRALVDRVSLPVLPIATETPAAIFGLGTYDQVADKLVGLTWGAEDLPAAIGATTSREADGGYTAPYQLARSLTLFGAHAAGVPAIETVYPDFRDLQGLRAYAERGLRDGFSAMMAVHPSQVAVINSAFSPTDAQVAHARAVVAAFANSPDAGALQLDGRMIDAPHLKSARRTLARLD